MNDLLEGKRRLVVTGAHAKTTAAMCAWILDAAGFEPGWAVGGDTRAGSSKRKIVAGGAKPAPFVIEGAAYIDPNSTVIVTSGETPVDRVGPDGLVVCDARSPVAAERTAFYALDTDVTGDVTPTWLGILVPPDGDVQPFDVFLGGSSGGRFALPILGEQNVRNALAALAACAEGFGVDVERARSALTSFKGLPT